MRLEGKVVIGILVLLVFVMAHLLYPIMSLWNHVFFMGISIGNILVDILFMLGIILQLYLIILIIRDEINGNTK